MNRQLDDARLTELLTDAVSDVEPRSALEDLRDRTRVTSITSRRPWLFATGGAVIATAAVITAIAFAGGSPTGTTTEPGPAETGQPQPTPTQGEDSPAPTSDPEPPEGTAIAVYYVGETPEGPRLYREFRTLSEPDHGPAGSIGLLTARPRDPDYRTLWPEGAFAGGGVTPDLITVDLADASLRERPTAMPDYEARLAIEQVVYTLQAYAQARTPVRFTVDGQPVDQVYGVPTAEPLANGPVLDTLARVSLTEPTEGQNVEVGGSLDVNGVANSFEANVVVRLQDADGTEVIEPQPITALGYMEEKLFPFEGTLDLSDVPAGVYVLSASTDDPSGQGLAHVDTRTIVIE